MAVVHERDHDARRAAVAPAGRPGSLTAGERWAAEALRDLRRARYRPVAWLRFVRVSLERSRDTRRQAPRLARQARTWGASGALAWVVACFAGRRLDGVRLRPVGGLAWWLAVCRMLDWHLGMVEAPDGRPRGRLAAPDALSLLRLWLVPVALGAGRSPAGLPAVIALGGLSDWLDGPVARRQGPTRLGRELDTTADLAFFAAAAVSARAAGRVTPLAFRALVARDALGLALSLGAFLGRARRPALEPRRWAAAPRVAGLALGAAGRLRAGTALVVCGCLVPPRSTGRGRSLA